MYVGCVGLLCVSMFVIVLFVVRETLPVLLQSSDIARLFPWSDLNTILSSRYLLTQLLYRTARNFTLLSIDILRKKWPEF